MLRVVAVATLGSVLMWSGCRDSGESPEAVGSPSPAAINVDSTPQNRDGAHSAEITSTPATGNTTSHQTADALDETELEVVDDYDDFDVGFEQDQPLPPYNAITREEFDACWQTSLSADGESAGELLAKLTEECGFAMDDQPQFVDALATLIKVEMTGVSRLQIIEEICNQAGLYPRYRLDRFALAAGPRPYPIAFAGPFLVEVRELQENPPHGTGMITLQFTGCTMSPDVNSWLQSGSQVSAIASVRGTGDVDVSEHHSYSREYPTATRQVVRYRTHQDLMYMVNSVEEIELLAGTIAFQIPGPLMTVQVEEIVSGLTFSIRSQHFQLGRVELGDTSVIVVSPRIGSNRGLQLMPRDINGSLLDTELTLNTFLSQQWTIQGEPDTIEFQQFRTSDVAYPYEITNIPLARSEEQPEIVEPMTFAGELPVTFSELRTMKDDAGLRFVVEATNHTNKDLSFIQIDVRYLDDDHQLLGFDRHSQPGFPAVAAGDAVDIEILGTFAPEGTESIAIELMGVRAPDATKWGWLVED